MSNRQRLALFLIAVLSTSLSIAFNRIVLEGIPHIQDEINYLWQAQVFAALQVTAPLPPAHESFSYPFLMETGGRVYSIFPPGWPWMLAVAVWFGIERLLPMILGGVFVVLVFQLARRLAGGQAHGLADREGRLVPWLAAVLAVISPAAVVMAGNWMAHTLCLVLLTLFLVAVHRLGTPDDASRLSARAAAVIAGASCGLLAAARPLDAVAGCAPYLGWLAWRSIRGRLPFRLLVLIALPAALFVGMLLAHNTALTGAPLRFPQNVYFSEVPAWFRTSGEQMTAEEAASFRFTETCNNLGLSADRGCGPTWGTLGHSPEKAARNLIENLKAFDRNLFGGAGGLLLMLPGLWFWRRRAVFLIPPIVAFPGLYALYWYHGIAYGARFLHPMLASVLVLCAAGLAWIAVRIQARAPRVAPPVVAALLVALVVVRGSSYVPALLSEYGSRYWCVDGSLPELIESLEPGRALVLVGITGIEIQEAPLSSLPAQKFRCNNFLRSGAGFQANDPFLQNEVIYGRMPASREGLDAVVRAFPDRRIWMYIQDRGREEVLEVTPQGFKPIHPAPLR